jgi:hypothetical protein
MNLQNIRNILNVAFMLLTAATIITYFACDNQTIFACLCGTAIALKMAESVLRFTDRKDKE